MSPCINAAICMIKNCNIISQNEGGGGKGRLEFFTKFIHFGNVTRPLDKDDWSCLRNRPQLLFESFDNSVLLLFTLDYPLQEFDLDAGRWVFDHFGEERDDFKRAFSCSHLERSGLLCVKSNRWVNPAEWTCENYFLDVCRHLGKIQFPELFGWIFNPTPK